MTSKLLQFGPWECDEQIGDGGNSTVFRAHRTATEGPSIALKVLDNSKVDEERYLRFGQEIRTLQGLGDFPGVLPLLEADLPESPTRRNRPWLVMPLATTLDKALKDAPVERIVGAIRDVADTLARLKEEHGIGHRDIKPSNLYELDGAFLVGDFGLVTVPDAEPLTTDARPVGPRHFMPYEMLVRPSTADPYAADVFCLAKTLWVLLNGQNFPLEGHQPAGARHFSLVDQRPHPGAPALDRLIDRMTLLDPTMRPSMAAVARDLDAWSHLEPGTREEIDVADAAARFRKAAAAELDAQDERVQQLQGAAVAIGRIIELTRRYDNAIGELRAPVAKYQDEHDAQTEGSLRVLGAESILVKRWSSTSRVAVTDMPGSVALRIARAIEVYANGDLFLMLRVEVKPDGALAGHHFYWQLPHAKAPVGSIEAERLVEQSAAVMEQPVVDALAKFIEVLEAG